MGVGHHATQNSTQCKSIKQTNSLNYLSCNFPLTVSIITDNPDCGEQPVGGTTLFTNSMCAAALQNIVSTTTQTGKLSKKSVSQKPQPLW